MNPAQQCAVDTRVPRVLVSAGAGSGKTRVLTTRYAALLLEDGLEPDEILTLTFTRKAAQEMRERIARLFSGTPPAGGRRPITRHALARAPLGTIHSFCERILREHALQAGIDPNFRLLDDAEARTLQEKALDAIFEDIWSGSPQQRVEIGRLLLSYPHGALRSALLGIFRHARTHGIPLGDIRPITPPDVRAKRARLEEAVDALLASEGRLKWKVGLEGTRTAYAELLQPLFDADWEDEERCWEFYAQALGAWEAMKPPGRLSREAKVLRDAVEAAHGDWLNACGDRIAGGYRKAFCRLLGRVEQAYRAAKDEQSLLDFEDLLLLCRALLVEERYGDSAARHYRARFKQVMVDEFQDTNPLQFSIIAALCGEDGHLFVVGDVKQAIYRFIGSDIGVFLGFERQIQATAAAERIAMNTNYRSRPEVLLPLNSLFQRLWPEQQADGFQFEALDVPADTFLPKSEPSIELALWYGKDGNAAVCRDQEAEWIARRILQLCGKLEQPALTLIERTGDETAPVLQARAATFRDVILLFRASSDIPRYEDALRSAGVPYYTVSGRGFYQAREVQDLVHLLRVLDNPLDDFALAVVLRSPLVGVSDATLYWLTRQAETPVEAEDVDPDAETSRVKAGRLWAAMTRLPEAAEISETDRQALREFHLLVMELQREMPAGQPLDLIDRILARTRYLACLLAGEGGEQRYANVQKLREVAARFQEKGIFDLSDFQRYLTQLRDLAPREASAPVDVEHSDVVRLMTIHASKGLEAPIVFLADAGREPSDNYDDFVLTADGSLTCKVPTPDDDWLRPATYNAMLAGQAVEDRREMERLLYVALTRAKEHLICCGFTNYPPQEKWKSYADILAGLLEIHAPCEEDGLLTVEGMSDAVRVWSRAALQQLREVQPPAAARTLVDEYADAINAGQALPLSFDPAERERFAQVVARLRPLERARHAGTLRLGVNRALCYTACPRQYWFRYLLKHEGSALNAPLPPVIADAREQEDDEASRTDGTEFGQLLHAVLQYIDLRQPLTAQTPAILDRLAAEGRLAVPPEARGEVDACLLRLQALPVYEVLTRATTLQRELRFLMRETAVYTPPCDLYVPGIIDALAQVDGQWWVIDYKTGLPSVNHRRQALTYALGVQRSLGITPERVALAYLSREVAQPYVEERVTDQLLADAMQRLRRAAEGMLAEDYHPEPGHHCEHCPFIGGCPEGVMAVTGRLAL